MPKDERQRLYLKLEKVFKEKGHFPFKKTYQKYKSLFLFMYNSILEILQKTGLQNSEGILFKITFNHEYTGKKKGIVYTGSILLEIPGIRYSKLKSFKFESVPIDEIKTVLEEFSEYYDCIFSDKGNDRYAELHTKYYYIRIAKGENNS